MNLRLPWSKWSSRRCAFSGYSFMQQFLKIRPADRKNEPDFSDDHFVCGAPYRSVGHISTTVHSGADRILAWINWWESQRFLALDHTQHICIVAVIIQSHLDRIKFQVCSGQSYDVIKWGLRRQYTFLQHSLCYRQNLPGQSANTWHLCALVGHNQ